MIDTFDQSAQQKTPACPFCNATDTEMIALFGSQLLTSQFYCHGCHTVFEAVRHAPSPVEGGADEIGE